VLLIEKPSQTPW